MDNDKSLAEYNVTETGFIVVMAEVAKPPKENNPAPVKKVSNKTMYSY